jgi:hypothetical protein
MPPAMAMNYYPTTQRLELRTLIKANNDDI